MVTPLYKKHNLFLFQKPKHCILRTLHTLTNAKKQSTYTAHAPH